MCKKRHMAFFGEVIFALEWQAVSQTGKMQMCSMWVSGR